MKNAIQRPKTVRQRSFPRAVRHVEFCLLLTKQASTMTAAVNDCKVKFFCAYKSGKFRIQRKPVLTDMNTSKKVDSKGLDSLAVKLKDANFAE